MDQGRKANLAAAVQATIASLHRSQTKFIDILDKLETYTIEGEKGFDADRLLPKLDLSYQFIVNRIGYIAAALETLPAELPELALPVANVRSMLTRATDVEQKAEAFLAHCQAVDQAGGAVAMQWSKIVVATADKKHAVDLVEGLLEHVLNQTDAMLVGLSQIQSAIGSEGANLTQVVEHTATLRVAAEQAAAAAAAALKEAEGLRDEASNSLVQIRKLAEEASSTEAAIRKTRDGLAAIEGDTNTRKAAADAALAAAAALKTQTDQYAPQFSAFMQQLESRNKAFDEGNTALAQLTKQLQDQAAQIQVNVNDATAMLASATNASLTHAQQIKYEELGNQLKSAGLWVLLAYVGLFASVAPVVNYVWESTTIEFNSVWTYLGNVLARAVLLIPGGVAASFTTRRYMRLFRLRHEYGYRASLAGAVEGFQRQAPDHHQDIAAVAFFQLGRNPAESIDGAHEPPAWNSKLQALLDRFSNRFGKPSPAE